MLENLAQQSRIVWRLREIYRTCYWTTKDLSARSAKLSEKVEAAVWGLPETTVQELLGVMLKPIAPESIILEHCCLPPYKKPHEHNDIIPLLQIAAHIKPEVILEVGTAHGNTVANLCRVCDAKIFTVNALPEEMSGHFTTFSLAKEDIGCIYRDHGYLERVVQIYANTMDLDLGQHLSTPTIDLAIIDACHDQDYVLNDFLKVVPFVRKGGLVMLHDTHPSMVGHLAGSNKACMRLRRAGFDIKHINGTWWGIWSKKAA